MMTLKMQKLPLKKWTVRKWTPHESKCDMPSLKTMQTVVVAAEAAVAPAMEAVAEAGATVVEVEAEAAESAMTSKRACAAEENLVASSTKVAQVEEVVAEATEEEWEEAAAGAARAMPFNEETVHAAHLVAFPTMEPLEVEAAEDMAEVEAAVVLALISKRAAAPVARVVASSTRVLLLQPQEATEEEEDMAEEEVEAECASIFKKETAAEEPAVDFLTAMAAAKESREDTEVLRLEDMAVVLPRHPRMGADMVVRLRVAEATARLPLLPAVVATEEVTEEVTRVARVDSSLVIQLLLGLSPFA